MTARATLLRAARLLAVVLVAATALGTLAAAVVALTERANVRPAMDQDDIVVVLAIGSDMGPPARPGNPRRGRADGLHLIAVDTQAKRATIVNIPRDSLWGGTRINSYLSLGGPRRQVAAVEDMTGIPIDYWVLTTFRGLRGLVNGLDGVEIEVERRMMDTGGAGTAFREAGTYRVDGREALAFLRDRKSLPDGDFGRTRNHGSFMRHAHAQLREEQSDLAGLTRQLGRFSRFTESNIPFHELLPLALLALEIDPADVHQEALTGSFGTVGGASIVNLRPGNAFARIRRGDVGPPD